MLYMAWTAERRYPNWSIFQIYKNFIEEPSMSFQDPSLFYRNDKRMENPTILTIDWIQEWAQRTGEKQIFLSAHTLISRSKYFGLYPDAFHKQVAFVHKKEEPYQKRWPLLDNQNMDVRRAQSRKNKSLCLSSLSSVLFSTHLVCAKSKTKKAFESPKWALIRLDIWPTLQVGTCLPIILKIWRGD